MRRAMAALGAWAAAGALAALVWGKLSERGRDPWDRPGRRPPGAGA